MALVYFVMYSVVYTHSLAFPLGSVYSLGVMSNIHLVSIFLVMLAHGRKCSKLQKTCWKYKDMHKFQTIHFFLEMLEILLISNIIVVYIWILNDVFSYPIELICLFIRIFTEI